MHIIQDYNTALLQDSEMRQEMKSSVFSKTTALDPRFHLLKFISDKHKILIWEELEIDLCEMTLEKQKIRNVVADQDKANKIKNGFSLNEEN